MRYYVTIGEHTLEVDLSGDTPVVDGVPVQAELAQVPGTPLRHLIADGASVPLHARPGGTPDTWDIYIGGRRLPAEVVDERTRAIRAMTGGGGALKGPKPVRAPMPGLVVRLEVEPGQAVEAGQGVAIVEAMKMENELKAEGPGVVSRVLVEPGQAVEKGVVLVEFEAPERDDG